MRRDFSTGWHSKMARLFLTNLTTPVLGSTSRVAPMMALSTISGPHTSDAPYSSETSRVGRVPMRTIGARCMPTWYGSGELDDARRGRFLRGSVARGEGGGVVEGDLGLVVVDINRCHNRRRSMHVARDDGFEIKSWPDETFSL